MVVAKGGDQREDWRERGCRWLKVENERMGIYKRRFRTGVLQVGKSIIGINTGSSSGGNVVVLGEENNRRAVQRQ